MKYIPISALLHRHDAADIQETSKAPSVRLDWLDTQECQLIELLLCVAAALVVSLFFIIT